MMMMIKVMSMTLLLLILTPHLLSHSLHLPLVLLDGMAEILAILVRYGERRETTER